MYFEDWHECTFISVLSWTQTHALISHSLSHKKENVGSKIEKKKKRNCKTEKLGTRLINSEREERILIPHGLFLKLFCAFASVLKALKTTQPHFFVPHLPSWAIPIILLPHGHNWYCHDSHLINENHFPNQIPYIAISLGFFHVFHKTESFHSDCPKTSLTLLHMVLPLLNPLSFWAVAFFSEDKGHLMDIATEYLHVFKKNAASIKAQGKGSYHSTKHTHPPFETHWFIDSFWCKKIFTAWFQVFRVGSWCLSKTSSIHI